MHPDAHRLWRAPRWTFAVLLAALAVLGPLSVDAYLPAFSGISQSLGASPVQMQQTLSAYLFGFGVMCLFHGALSDSFGRRPMVLWGLAIFTFASAGCALSASIGQLVLFRALQGLASGACIVISRAIPRDMFAPGDAQRIMSMVTIFFAGAAAVAPFIGGWMFVWLGWRSVFWAMVIFGSLLWVANLRLLPETLHHSHRQPFEIGNLLRGYVSLGRDPRVLMLAVAVGVPFSGTFVYITSTQIFLGQHLGLAPTQFFWLFVLNGLGIVCGAWVSGRIAGKMPPKRQIRHGFVIMVCAAAINLLANLVFTAHVAWALLPLSLSCFGWALMNPAISLLLLDLHPERRGMAASLQIFMASMSNSITAGVLAPLVMHSTVSLAWMSVAILSVGLCAWMLAHRRWPEIGKVVVRA